MKIMFIYSKGNPVSNLKALLCSIPKRKEKTSRISVRQRLILIIVLTLFSLCLTGCGIKNCPVCNGKSFCYDCGGNGECDKCGGEGVIFINETQEYIACPKCDGDKDCPTCDGNRVCPNCKGRGKVSVWGKWRQDVYDIFMF